MGSQALLDRWNEYYERSIDFGAHPNERALTSRLNFRRENDKLVSSVIQLSDQAVHYEFIAQVGIEVAAVCLTVFGRLFKPRLVVAALDAEVETLSKTQGLDL